MRTATLVALLGVALPVELLAEAGGEHAPYAGWDGRAIKALSAAQIDDLRSGRGMGLALAAELNGYPGPRHVLELADRLDLTADQQAQTQRLFDAMQAQAIALGEQVIAAEAALDRLFATGTASDAAIQAAAVEVGRLQGASCAPTICAITRHARRSEPASAHALPAAARLCGRRARSWRARRSPQHAACTMRAVAPIVAFATAPKSTLCSVGGAAAANQ